MTLAKRLIEAVREGNEQAAVLAEELLGTIKIVNLTADQAIALASFGKIKVEFDSSAAGLAAAIAIAASSRNLVQEN